MKVRSCFAVVFRRVKSGLSFGAKSLREFGRQSEIVRGRARPEVEHERIDFLCRESLQIRIQRVQVRLVQRAEAKIADMALDDFAVKWRRGSAGSPFASESRITPRPSRARTPSKAARLSSVSFSASGLM